ncbi:VPS9 domain-containing protein 1-like isoform X2 [Corticium candelabrum]|uniref:VPS9 domain-containing protein 1-like isoform X2 n=1 Tax=Corticium candelabrum TaxID=121492 RepID=UPI002E271170|nr:VPS9 domain-containing protein 1-like isoform X2 [Corticium candelabrum]
MTECCRVGDRLPVAMRGIGEAMTLDKASRKTDAYVKYLSCVFYTVQALLDDAAGRDICELSREMCTKFFKLSQQCLERASDLMRELAGTGTKPTVHQSSQHRLSHDKTNMQPDSQPVHERSQSRSPLPSRRTAHGDHLLLGPPAGEQKQRSLSQSQISNDGNHSPNFNATRSLPVPSAMHTIDPMEFAYRQNQHLISAYRARMAKLHSEGARARLNLTMLRRLDENMAIAKRRQDTLLAKIQEREKRQKEAEKSRNSATLGSVTSDRLVQMADEFASKNSWVAALLAKISGNCDDVYLVNDFIMKVLSSTDHPLARQLGTFQYSVYQKLLPLYRRIQKDFILVTPPVDRQDPDLSSSAREPSSRLDSKTRGSDANATSGSTLQKLRAALMAGGEQDLCDKSDAEHSDNMNRLELNISVDDKDSEQKNGVFSCGDLSSNASLTDIQQSDSNSTITSTLPTDSLTGSGLTVAVRKAADRADEFACEEQLRHIIRDIHNHLDELQQGFVTCYKELDSPEGRDECCSSIEQRFFPPIWLPLLALIRQSKASTEHSLAAVMSSMYHASPRDFSVREQLCLVDDLNTEAAGDPVPIPYEKAIDQLKTVVAKKCPLDKLDCIVSTSRCIMECADEYWEGKGKGRQSKEATMGTDDLLPVLTYVVVKTRLPQLVSECVAMEEFIHEGYLMGEEGYCLTSLQTAVLYSTSLASKSNV